MEKSEWILNYNNGNDNNITNIMLTIRQTLS